jgi:hypothetical protein
MGSWNPYPHKVSFLEQLSEVDLALRIHHHQAVGPGVACRYGRSKRKQYALLPLPRRV